MAAQTPNAKQDRSDVHIVEINRRFLVRPSPVVPKNNKKFRISNLTPYPATVTILPGLELEAEQGASVPIGSFAYEDIRLGANAERCYTYQVTVHVNGQDWPAEGESDPVIIIDPPAS
jgi:hypothetical protein